MMVTKKRDSLFEFEGGRRKSVKKFNLSEV